MRRGLLALLAVSALAPALDGCRVRKKAPIDAAVIASVNGETLSRADFAHDLSREIDSLGDETPPTPEQLEPLKRQLLQRVIERTLLLQAARERNVTVTPEEVDRAVLKMSADYPADGFDAALVSGEVSMAELKQKEADRLTVERLFEQHVYARVGVTEEEIRSSFDAHPERFLEPEEVHALQIVVKDLDEAKRVQAQLKAGKKFSDLARRYSLSPDAKVGGDLGFFPRGVMPPQFDEVAFRLGVGQTSDVVATDYGFHLFRVLEKRPPRKKQLAQVRGEVEKHLVEDKRAEAQTEFVQGLKNKAQIQINEPVLQSMTGEVHRSTHLVGDQGS